MVPADETNGKRHQGSRFNTTSNNLLSMVTQNCNHFTKVVYKGACAFA